MESPKVKSAAKVMVTKGPELDQRVLNTLKTCRELVGATLGPGGRPVIIEAQDNNLPPVITKDGVTVFRSIAFKDPVSQILMEAARDTATKTASDVGDGTTSATILAESLVFYTQKYCRNNPHTSPQSVVSSLQKLFGQVMEPTLGKMKVSFGLHNPEGRNALLNVAKVSANGDEELANAVMKCFDIIGDEGNVTLTESSGPHQYIVQKIDGYPVNIGYEDSCGFGFQKFINDTSTQSSVIERPVFLLHYGKITDFKELYPILVALSNTTGSDAEIHGKKISQDIVIVATGFSENVVANLALQFASADGLKAFPLKIPLSPVKSGTYDFLLDLSAMTGGRIFDPLEYPLQNFDLNDLGIGPRVFEATRWRSNIIGHLDDELVFQRVDQLQKQLVDAGLSELEKQLLRERLAKMTSGIAKLVIQGSSSGDIKERRDRAEDAICAVRAAIKHGVLPGGGVGLVEMSRACSSLKEGPLAEVARVVAAPALLEPVFQLYSNAGYTKEEAEEFIQRLCELETLDVSTGEWVDPFDAGVLDSLPAVREATRNALSIARLGTCGGVIAFPRDYALEVSEAKDTAEFLRNVNINEANERP